MVWSSIPANSTDFIGRVPIFGFQNLEKFLEFHPVNILLLKIIISIFPGLFSTNWEEKFCRFADCSALSICFDDPLPQVFSLQWARGVWWEALVSDGDVRGLEHWWKCPDFWFPNVSRYGSYRINYLNFLHWCILLFHLVEITFIKYNFIT